MLTRELNFTVQKCMCIGDVVHSDTDGGRVALAKHQKLLFVSETLNLYFTPCRGKNSLWFTMHNCNKFEYIFTVFLAKITLIVHFTKTYLKFTLKICRPIAKYC